MTTDRAGCIAGIERWEAAECAYREESARYVSVAFLSAGESLEPPERVLTRDALEELRALRRAADAAQANYEKVCANQ